MSTPAEILQPVLELFSSTYYAIVERELTPFCEGLQLKEIAERGRKIIYEGSNKETWTWDGKPIFDVQTDFTGKPAIIITRYA